MKYYAAVVDEFEIGPVVVQPPYCLLASYHYFKKWPELMKDCVAKGYEMFLDSGAFSAASKGATINIEDYCRFIVDTGVKVYAGLDVIGDPIATAKNVKWMESNFGLDPIPTFHLGSDTQYLYTMISKYPYIALGGLVFASGQTRYCDEVWSIILKHAPGLKVHGFGLTNVDLMTRYPWYSVDSSSYKGCKRFGRQQILWNGFEFKMMPEAEYIDHLVKQGYERSTLEGKENNKRRWFIYDYYGVQSYKQFGAHLAILNKTKKFDYLTAQQKLI